jgi:hypothetical protein
LLKNVSIHLPSLAVASAYRRCTAYVYENNHCRAKKQVKKIFFEYFFVAAGEALAAECCLCVFFRRRL